MINTYSQAGQDIFALDENKNLSNLFFIDIGYKLKYGNVMFEGNIYEDWFTL